MKRHTCVTRYRKQSTKGKTEANAAKNDNDDKEMKKKKRRRKDEKVRDRRKKMNE